MDVQLLLALVIGIAVIVVIVLRTRLDAFVALLLAALITGLVSGHPTTQIVKSFTTGFGNTLASIGIVIGLGVGMGRILEVSGAADSLARGFLKLFGRGKEPWAMASVGALVSIPVFCDSGFVIMNPLARSIARVKRGAYVTLALALAGGLVLTHHLVPPTPGPLAVAGIIGVDLGVLIVTGLAFTVCLIPVVVAYARFIGPRLEATLDEEVAQEVYTKEFASVGAREAAARASAASGEDSMAAIEHTVTYHPEEFYDEIPEGQSHRKPGAFMGFLPLFIPLLLIVLNTVATAIDKSQQNALNPNDEYTPSSWAAPLIFLGDPVVALAIGVILAVYVLLPRWVPQKKVHSWLAEAAASAGLILLITGSGGGFGQVLRDSGVGDALAKAIAATPLPAFLVPFIIASVVRVAQGSGTVAMITAASVTAPLVSALGVSGIVVVIACVTGAMLFSYFNDSYFWVVTTFTGLSGTAALRGWSGMTTVVWASCIPLLIILNLIVG